MDGRAQSESVGVILLTVVIVIIATLGAAVVLGGFGGDGDSAPLVEFTVEMTATDISVTHAGGDTVAQSELTIIARGDSTEEQYGFDAANVSGDGDGQFEPSERFRRDHDVVGQQVDVLVVHDASNSVLARETLTVDEPDEQRPPAARFSATPEAPDPGETVTFDASASTDGDGTVAEYRWAFGDGTTATTTDPTVGHTYASEGEYTVSLTVSDDDGATDTANRTYTVTTLRAPDDPENVSGGLRYDYYEGTYTSLPDFDAETPTATGTVEAFDISVRERDENFAVRYTGYVEVPEDGQYTFTTDSDDGSRLYIGDERVVDNPGLHSARERSGTIGLQSGRHEVTVTYFEHTGQEVLDVRWNGPGIASERTIPQSRLVRTDGPRAAVTTSCGGLNCTFDASGTTAPGGTVTSYEWTFGDGTTATTTDPTTTHNYSSGGDYTVSLTVTDDAGRTDTTTRTTTVVEPRPAVDPDQTTNGLAYSYYEADPIDDRSDLQPSAIVRNGTTDGFDLEPPNREENFGFRYTGYVEVPETGNYTFYTTSDDGSRLYIGDELVVRNDGLHAAQTRSGEIALEAGKHPITVTYFEHTIDDSLRVEYEGPGVSRQEVPASALSRDRETARWETAPDWDEAVLDESVVHDSVGDHSPSAVELGYAATDRNGSALLTYYPFDGDATDASANGHDGTVDGASVASTGLAGTRSFAFDGDEDVIRDDDAEQYLNGNDAVTISVWVRSDRTGTDRGILNGRQPNGQDTPFSLRYDASGFEADCTDCIKTGFGVSGSETVYESASDGQTTEWQHLVVTWESGEPVRLYRDGVNDTATYREAGDGTISNLDRLLVGQGAKDDGNSDGWDGQIDELRLYDRQLGPDEVQRLYNVSRRGTLTTGTRTFDYAVAPSALSLENVSAARPAGTAIDVTVLSDPDGDGTFEEQSATITLDGSSSYDVTGLTTESRRYRLDVELRTSTPTATPTVDRLELSG